MPTNVFSKRRIDFLEFENEGIFVTKKDRGKRKEVNKILIKIIKRKDVKAIANAKTQIAGEPKQISSVSEEISGSRLRRALVKEISKWIPERGKNSRIEDVSAIRHLFGDDSLMGKT